jgi:hypothetical protein
MQTHGDMLRVILAIVDKISYNINKISTDLPYSNRFRVILATIDKILYDKNSYRYRFRYGFKIVIRYQNS